MENRDRVKVGIATAGILGAAAVLAWQFGAFTPPPPPAPPEAMIEQTSKPTPRGGMMLPPK